MLLVRMAAIALVAASTFAVTPGAEAQPSPWAVPRAVAPQCAPQVYLLKGLADVFSSGMDSLAAKLRRRGITARVASHASSDSLADEVIRAYRAGSRGPIVIAGHSLGADAAVSMAQRLNDARVPVALVMTFGPLNNPRATPNVARAVNYYQANSAWHGQIVRGPGFHGALTNINLDKAADVNHFNIEKVERIQNEAVARIVAAIGGSRRPTTPKPDTDSPGDEAKAHDAAPSAVEPATRPN